MMMRAEWEVSQFRAALPGAVTLVRDAILELAASGTGMLQGIVYCGGAIFRTTNGTDWSWVNLDFPGPQGNPGVPHPDTGIKE